MTATDLTTHGRWGMVERVFDLHRYTPIAGWTPVYGVETAPLPAPATQRS